MGKNPGLGRNTPPPRPLSGGRTDRERQRVTKPLDERVRAEMVALLPRLRRFARGLVGAPDQADDLVQAACERAIARIEQWTPGTRLDSWMFRIVQTIWLDERRAAKGRTGGGRGAAAQTDDTGPLVQRLRADGAQPAI